jgi:cell division protein FtsW
MKLQQALKTWLIFDNKSEPYDRKLLLATLLLMAIGLVMVTSASMSGSPQSYSSIFHYMVRHSLYLCGCIGVGIAVLSIDLEAWFRYSSKILLAVLVLLVLVLMIGTTVNGATRWLSFGFLRLQIAELAKFAFAIYLAGYLVRRYQEVRYDSKGFYKPILVLMLYSSLLLMQPDMGSVVVLFVIALGVLFLAGSKLRDFFLLLVAGLILITGLSIFSPYRLRRLTGFLDPWSDPFGSGYQLTQSLMAYGRGGLLGEGLGNSIQKLKYLPEAHTDFIMAIVGEELGFMGVASILMLLLFVAYRAMLIGNQCLDKSRPFPGFVAYAFGVWFFFQTLVNVGASMGLLPTKGLTLPFISYGGSSLLIMTISVMILIRISYELNNDGRIK